MLSCVEHEKSFITSRPDYQMDSFDTYDSRLFYIWIFGWIQIRDSVFKVWCNFFKYFGMSVIHINWAVGWDFQQCGMCDQQNLRSPCAYRQSDQSLC